VYSDILYASSLPNGIISENENLEKKTFRLLATYITAEPA
jgi:hypothetical protein